MNIPIAQNNGDNESLLMEIAINKAGNGSPNTSNYLLVALLLILVDLVVIYVRKKQAWDLIFVVYCKMDG
ncbi:hypothetical protein [Virgibacillus ainsalahensis]